MPTVLNHIAFVVPDLDATPRLAELGLTIGPAESFPREGTTEVYVGDGPGRILLMRPDAPGPYARALVRRGPGLHHVALDVPDLDAFVDDTVRGTGWLLHPISLQTRRQSATIWLARPGVAALVEVRETTRPPTGPSVVERVAIQGLATHPSCGRLFDGLTVPIVGGPVSAIVVGTQTLDLS